MASNDTPFGASHGNPLIAEAEIEASRAAFRFIRRGLTDMAGTAIASVELLELMVYAKLADIALGGGLLRPRPIPSRTAKAWASALTQAHINLLQAYTSVAKRLFDGLPAPVLGVPDNETTEAANAERVTGLDSPSLPDAKQLAKQPASYAYEMTRANRLRCEQRLCLLFALANSVRHAHRSTLHIEAVEQEFNAATKALWARRQSFELQEFALATLLGGEALTRCKAETKRTLGQGYGVRHLVELDGVLPGRWRSSEEDALRAAIQAS